jgi:membrane protease subunit (stomatin/prohibitin family)
MPKQKRSSIWAEIRAEMKRAKEQQREGETERIGWECARCATFNHGNPTYCGCGAYFGLAAIY